MVPRAKLFMTLGPSRDKLTMIPLDLNQAIDEAGIDFLLVTSSPPGSFAPGSDFRYAIRTRSKAGGVKYALDAAAGGHEGRRRRHDHLACASRIRRSGRASDCRAQGRGRQGGVPQLSIDQERPGRGVRARSGTGAGHGCAEGRSQVRLPAYSLPPTLDSIAARLRTRRRSRIAPKCRSRTPTTARSPPAPDATSFCTRKRRKAIVFDVSTAKVTHTIDLGDDKAVIATGMSQLLVYRPSSNDIEKFSLATGVSAGKESSALKGVSDMAMGSASDGPLFVRAGKPPSFTTWRR